MFFLVSIFFLLNGAFSEPDPELRMRSLKDTSVELISKTAEQPRLWIVFQKDCQACRKQIKDLACLNEKKVSTYLVGAYSTEQDLRKEYKKFNTTTPAFYGDREFKDYFKLNREVTPEIIIQHGNVLKKHIGRLPCATLLKALSSLGQ